MDKTKIAVEIFNKHAEAYQDRFMDVSMYHDSFDLFCSYISKANADVLELACGPGNITKYLLSKRSDFNMLATDLAPNMIALAKENNPSATVELLDSRDINKLSKTFDALVCGFILPYLNKDETSNLICNAFNVLNDDGVLYISTMEDDHQKSSIVKNSAGDELYMYFYECEYLIEILKANGFHKIDIQRKVYKMKELDTVDLIIIARK